MQKQLAGTRMRQILMTAYKMIHYIPIWPTTNN